MSRRGTSVRIAVVAVLAVMAVGLVTVSVLRETGDDEPSPTRSNATAAAPTDDTRRVAALFVGDSFTEGTGAAPREGWTYQVCRALDWVCNSDAEGGTGFVADGSANDPSYAALADRLPGTAARLFADVVVVDAGRNDSLAPPAELTAAIDDYLAAVRARWPQASLVLVAPFFLTSVSDPGSYESWFAVQLRAAAETYDAVVVDPVAEGWLDGLDIPAITYEDDVHPNQAGHDLIAERFVADMRSLGIDRARVTDTGP